MPATPWVQRARPAPGAQYLAMASRLPLQHHRSVPGFLRDALFVQKQLAKSPGLVGYTLKADIFSKTFWTFSVWETQSQLDAFARSEPHRSIIERLRPHMGETRFEFFPVQGATIPMKWAEVRARLSAGTSEEGS
ncbi:MAG TPA: hypothetical protein VME20_09330 [Acidimicrobiales bacterium]|nr:hypothetical protein [Acidimicrobiales bacterium]